MGLPGMDDLYVNIAPGGGCKPKPCMRSLCDVAQAPDAKQRMLKYLNASIKLAHFEMMKANGFNFVQLPLG